MPRERDTWPTCRQLAGLMRHLVVEAHQEMFGIRILTACKKEMRGEKPASIALNLHDDEPWDRRPGSMDCGHCKWSKALSFVAGNRLHGSHRKKIPPYFIERYGIEHSESTPKWSASSRPIPHISRAPHDGPKP